MAPKSKTFEYGTLDSNTDTWFLRKPNRFILLDVPFIFDSSLRHKAVSVIGTMGVPESALGLPSSLSINSRVMTTSPNARTKSISQTVAVLQTTTGCVPSVSC
jgi:hypothetical protein